MVEEVCLNQKLRKVVPRQVDDDTSCSPLSSPKLELLCSSPPLAPIALVSKEENRQMGERIVEWMVATPRGVHPSLTHQSGEVGGRDKEGKGDDYRLHLTTDDGDDDDVEATANGGGCRRHDEGANGVKPRTWGGKFSWLEAWVDGWMSGCIYASMNE